MKANFAGCVILYNPEKEDIANILTYVNHVKKLYVFDNTESNSNQDRFEGIENIAYFWDGVNKGLSVRLNEACQKAIDDNFDFLLTMDQDSSFLEKNIAVYFNQALHYKEKDNVAVYGLEYKYAHQKVAEDLICVEKKDHVITSASLINLKLYDSIGGFDENLFIDGVDIDYCYAALVKGYEIIQFKNNYFKHSLGEPVKRRSIFTFFLLKKINNIHSPLRIYYMHRNRLYLEQKYKAKLPKVVIGMVKNYKHNIAKSIKHSENIFLALRFKRKAENDFKSNRMGKIQL